MTYRRALIKTTYKTYGSRNEYERTDYVASDVLKGTLTFVTGVYNRELEYTNYDRLGADPPILMGNTDEKYAYAYRSVANELEEWLVKTRPIANALVELGVHLFDNGSPETDRLSIKGSLHLPTNTKTMEISNHIWQDDDIEDVLEDVELIRSLVRILSENWSDFIPMHQQKYYRYRHMVSQIDKYDLMSTYSEF